MSRDWLKTTSASLSKLEQVSPMRYHVGLTNAKKVETTASRKQTSVLYTDLETDPPISSLTSQKSIWGSSSSINELIQKQDERQKYLERKQPRRPWSGKKSTTGPRRENEKSKPTTGPKISVLGSHYQPQSRPPSGRPRSTSRPTSHGEFVSHEEREDFLFERFIQYQHNNVEDDTNIYDEGAAVACHDEGQSSKSSRGKMTEDELSSEYFKNDRKGQSDAVSKELQHQSTPVKQLLRKPTPEPIRLSMTLPKTTESWSTDEDDQEIDSECSTDDDNDDLELQSVTSEMSTRGINCLRPLSPNLDEHGGVTYVSVTPRDMMDSTGHMSAEKCGTHPRELDFESEYKETVLQRNRDPNEADKKQETEFARHAKKQIRDKPEPQNDNEVETNVGALANTEKDETAMKYAPKPPRPRSSKPKGRNRPIPKVELDYGSAAGEKHIKGGSKFELTAGEVETMMSRLAIEECQDGSPAYGTADRSESDANNNVAEYGKRTFQKSSSSFNGNLSDLVERNDGDRETKLTTKTVEFSTDGIKENVSVSVLKNIPEPKKKASTGFAPKGSPKLGLRHTHARGRAVHSSNGGDPSVFSAAQKDDGSDSRLKTHSGIVRPMMIQSIKISERPLSRPGSRMSHRENDSPSSDGGSPSRVETEKDDESMMRSPPSHRKEQNKRQRPKSAVALSKYRNQHQKDDRRASPSVKLHSNSSRTLTPQTKRTEEEVKRNREAARALREGTLTSSKKFVKDHPTEEVKPVSPSRVPSPVAESSEASSSDSDFDFPKSNQEETVFAVRQKLRLNGVNVPFKTLKRGLMSPSERGFDECMSQLPETTSASLLNQPEVWLGKVFRKYKLADKALQRANERMATQIEMEAKAAARAKETADSRKKKKRTKKRKAGAKRKTKPSRVKSTVVT